MTNEQSLIEAVAKMNTVPMLNIFGKVKQSKMKAA